MEKLKLKYVTLKERLDVKSVEANETVEERDKIVEQCVQVESRIDVLRTEVELLEERNTLESERHANLHKQLKDGTFNTEELRHTNVHISARHLFNKERSEILQDHLQKIRQSTQDKNVQCVQLTQQTNKISEKVHQEEDRIKTAYKRVKELEASFSDLVDQLHMLRMKGDETVDQEDKTNERISRMKQLVKQTIKRAEGFEALEEELEDILKKSDDQREEIKLRYEIAQNKLNELVNEITEM